MLNLLKKLNAKQIISNLIFNKNWDFKILDSNWDKIIKICSNQLILPSLHVKINKTEIKAPEDVKEYIEQIYLINQNRNRKLIAELREIGEVLNSNKINFVYIKGAALLIKGFYKEFDRMIGDIDLLVEFNDFNKAVKILKDYGYKSNNLMLFSYQKHYPRLIRKDSLFAVEVHRGLLNSHKSLLDIDYILKSKIFVNNLPVPSDYHQLLIIIYNFQINDFGYLSCSYSIKTLIDTKEILSKNIFELPVNKFTKSYNQICSEYYKDLELFKIKEKKKISIKIRLYLKDKYNFYSSIDYFISRFLGKLHLRKKQIIEFLKSSLFRKHILFKIIYKN